MAKTKYFVRLTEKEKNNLLKIILSESTEPSTKVRAQVLLYSDVKQSPRLSVPKIEKLTGTSHQTISKIRRIYFEKGLETALHVLQKGEYHTLRHSDELLTQLKQLLQEPPPSGKKRWTCKLLTAACMERGYVKTISYGTIAKIIQTNGLSTKIK